MSWNLPVKDSFLSKGVVPSRRVLPVGPRPIARSSLTFKQSTPWWQRMDDAMQTTHAQLQAELESLQKAITVLNQLAAELDIHAAMQNVRQVALELLDCERVTLFLIFERRRELRAMIDQSEILRIQFGEGIAGLVAQTGGSMNLPDVYAHPMFNKEVDRLTGFRTRSMLCMSVSDMTGKNVAVLQALNKKSGQPFTPADERNLKLFGTHLGNTLVKAKLHETAKREKERLQAIYNCFKALSTSEEVGQMVMCATAALERHIIHADRVFFFLVDKPRGELWLHTHQSEPMRLRAGAQGGILGLCAESKKPQSWAEFEDPSQDPVLRRLAPQLAPARIKSVLVQPIHGTNNDRVLAVVLAINKREAEGTSDIFFEPFFTEADCDAMALFAYEVGDLLSERSLELSLLSALSVVGHDGAHPNARRSVYDAGEAGGDGGVCCSPHPASSLSGDEDLIRSQLIQMYLPEYKKESASSNGVFSRNSFSAANATANQMRASIERKRSAYFFDGPAKRGLHGNRDVVSASGRLGLALVAAARSSMWTCGRGPVAHSVGGDEGRGSAGTPMAGGSEPPGSPAAGSDISGDMHLMPNLRALRSASSTHAEHPSIAMRFGGSLAGGAPASMRSGGSLTVGTAPASSAAHARALLLRSGRAMLARPASGPCRGAAPPPSPLLQPSGQLPSPQWRGAHPVRNDRGHSAGVGQLGAGFGRLMAPWRQPMDSSSAGGTPDAAVAGGAGAESLSDGSSDEEGDRGPNEEEPEDEEEEVGVDQEVARGATAGAGGGEGRGDGGQQSPLRGPSRPMSEQHDAVLLGPFSHSLDVEVDLRAPSELTLFTDVADPQALRTHLSCTNMAHVGSSRSPCFYSREQLRSWEWDFTEYNVEELIKLAYDIFIVSGAMEDFEIKPKVLRNFLTAVASHYHSIPYHNFNHVCHVLHATFLISSFTRANESLRPLERLALLLAALCHDLDHDGHSNSFHINTGSELSRIYNDQSVMENHHCAMTFAILSRTDCNVFAMLSPEEQRLARKYIISAVLCTDMANHFTLTQEFQKHSVVYDPENESDRMLLLKVVLHAADIGNAVRPFHVNHAMSRRVHREFEAQANEEVQLGLPITFSVDTSDHVMCARVELNFLDYVVTTLWERLVDVLPELAPQLSQLRINRARYRRIADTGKTADQVLAEESQLEKPEQQPDAAVGREAAAGPSAELAPLPDTAPRSGPGCAALTITADDDDDDESAAEAQDMLVSPAGTSVPRRLPNGHAEPLSKDSVMSDTQDGAVNGRVEPA